MYQRTTLKTEIKYKIRKQINSGNAFIQFKIVITPFTYLSDEDPDI
jgi:hypothetical protein